MNVDTIPCEIPPLIDKYKRMLGDVLADNAAFNVYSNGDTIALLTQVDTYAMLEQAMSFLTPQQRRAFKLTCGWDGQTALTYVKAGVVMGVSRTRIWYLKHIAVRKLVQCMRRHGAKYYVNTGRVMGGTVPPIGRNHVSTSPDYQSWTGSGKYHGYEDLYAEAAGMVEKEEEDAA